MMDRLITASRCPDSHAFLFSHFTLAFRNLRFSRTEPPFTAHPKTYGVGEVECCPTSYETSEARKE